ncbi:MAG: hypothetical protein A3F94_00620 [Candidatus Spechtbacteria bacterium RIFCSPLOWO2_12_FULL_38_22]|uniref:VOC domain-containing protein n=1 Tax=Candidatus Spechtbacteria bacterium RIFCSPLOWO2_12_FULL_38_22 TaxID=1802165 RepID=A0A1G2HHD8_9BACT|nr:MAG: hypothetical protein A2728_02825 [Candidatus Spechtbacteria bacterium RIFCSPHIGHO2_01_FULL_38_11]OGZ59629.1 MAG: hypothetical protein A3A00_00310 [Candidatus Spechtbacteria bacterium RIFCSPLOWO2_01_FULL_38_20]OGZ60027.1 MAG: hypothetical protein A3E58_01625 [Candidatus Spechtbacteria bacterium RIFCSPHIGHO2_12_FULL_38_30]OGZ61897.1 MAG: hypothetical protein A3F94_00620 [Candidatus Spechtbacteria bacterium RIFCSPLOWO2_12_FULL_38_22]
MIKSHLYHASINASDPDFYKDLLTYLGFKTIVEYPRGFGMGDGTVSLWVFKMKDKYKDVKFHRKATGLNHLAFRVSSKKEVDQFHKEYLLANRIPILYTGPKEYPQYEHGYYAVYFEDPDRIKLEVVYKP